MPRTPLALALSLAVAAAALAGDPQPGKPAETGESLLGEKLTSGEATATRVKVNAPDVVPDLVWSGDGKFVYVLERKGILRKIAVPGFVEERRAVFANEVTSLARSREGLLVASPAAKEVELLDEQTLAVKKKIPAQGVNTVVASPRLSIAYGLPPGSLLDLGKGAVTKKGVLGRPSAKDEAKIKRHPDSDVPGGNAHTGAITPDGKLLLCPGPSSIHRFRTGADPVCEEIGPAVASDPQRIEVSSDGRYVALPCSSGSRQISDHPPAPGGTTFVYKVKDLQRPVLTITAGPSPRALAFDPRAGKVYTHNAEHQLIVYSALGVREAEYAFTGRDATRQILVYPEGSRLLVLTETALLEVELPRPGATKGAKPSDDWLGSPEVGKPEGKPTATGESLAGEKRVVDDLEATTVKVDAPGCVPSLVWSDDGKFVWVLERAGLLRKVAFPSLVEERQLALGHACSWLDRSKAGLVVVSNATRELLVLDERLAIEKRIPAENVQVVAASPASDVAWGATAAGELLAFDLKKGTIRRRFDATKLGQEQGQNVKHPAGVFPRPTFGPFLRCTPDGKFLLAAGAGIHRFAIKDAELGYEEVGPNLESSAQRLEVSPDSALVAYVCGNGDDNPPGHPRVVSGTYVYKVGDLSTPCATIASGPVPRALAFEKSGRFLAQSSDKQLAFFTDAGEPGKSYALTEPGDDVEQILPHPSGKGILVLTRGSLVAVEAVD